MAKSILFRWMKIGGKSFQQRRVSIKSMGKNFEKVISLPKKRR